MKKFLTIFGILLFSVSLTAQNDKGTTSLSDGYKITRGDIKGHPFVLEDFKLGYGVFNDGRQSDAQLFNYDVYGNNLTYKLSPDADVMVLDEDSFVGFVIQAEHPKDDDMVFRKIQGSEFEKDKGEVKFYEIAKAPSSKVIIEYVKEYDDPNSSGWSSSSTNTRSAEYELKTTVYVLNKNGKYEDVKLRKRSVLKLFKDKKSQLSKFIDNNRIEFDEAKDLVDLVEYYHEII